MCSHLNTSHKFLPRQTLRLLCTPPRIDGKIAIVCREGHGGLYAATLSDSPSPGLKRRLIMGRCRCGRATASLACKDFQTRLWTTMHTIMSKMRPSKTHLTKKKYTRLPTRHGNDGRPNNPSSAHHSPLKCTRDQKPTECDGGRNDAKHRMRDVAQGLDCKGRVGMRADDGCSMFVSQFGPDIEQKAAAANSAN